MKKILSFSLLGVLCGFAPHAQAQTTPVFADEFNTSNLDGAAWLVRGRDYHLQRTQWSLAPSFGADIDGTKFLRVPLQTYNPNPLYTGKEMLACQLESRRRFGLGAGLEYEARIRSNNLPPGLVLGYYAYADAGLWQDTYQKTETDYEFLTSQARDSIWLNIWDEWNPLRGGPNKATLTSLSGLDWNNGAWNTYKIRWFPDHTDWLVNDRLMRTENVVRPNVAMGVNFNLWAAASGWGTAYNSNLLVASTPAQNQNYSFDVDYIRVRPIAATNSAVWGTGTGLTATYFDNKDFTSPTLIRRDPRVNFDWGSYAPVPGMGVDAFSVRWQGILQAQYTEDYTFTTRSDDGVRLWINGQIVIDNMRDQSATNVVSRPIHLTAGASTSIRLDYYDNTGGAVAQLFWESASTPKQLVPQSQLYGVNIVAKPWISLASGTYVAPKSVVLTSSTPNAIIYYTLDGSDPASSRSWVASGGSVLLPIGRSVLIAQATRAGSAPSDVAIATFVLTDSVKPILTISQPTNGAHFMAMPTASGTASDAESGISRVDLVIRRLSDNSYWHQTRGWVSSETGLPTTISGTNWTCNGPFPTGANLLAGGYELKAVAYDNGGNVQGKLVTITIDPASKPAAPSAKPTPTSKPTGSMKRSYKRA